MYPRKYLRRVSQTPKPTDTDKLRHFLQPLELKWGHKKNKKKTSSYTTSSLEEKKKKTILKNKFFFFYSLHYVRVAKMKYLNICIIKDQQMCVSCTTPDSSCSWFIGFIEIVVIICVLYSCYLSILNGILGNKVSEPIRDKWSFYAIAKPIF